MKRAFAILVFGILAVGMIASILFPLFSGLH
jgi:hypothetical protein